MIISDDITHSLLSDTSTDLSDTEAGTIWGKYVPVTVYARENKYNNAIDIFRLCQSRALSQPTAAMRTTERKICYDRLASNLGTAMDNTAELKFMTSYNISDNRWNTVNQTDSEF